MKVQGEKTEVKSVGDQFIAADGFKTLPRALLRKPMWSFMRSLPRGDQAALNPITTPPAASIQAYRRPGVLAGAYRPLTIEGLFPSLPISTNSFEYVKEKDDGFRTVRPSLPKAHRSPLARRPLRP